MDKTPSPAAPKVKAPIKVPEAAQAPKAAPVAEAPKAIVETHKAPVAAPVAQPVKKAESPIEESAKPDEKEDTKDKK